MAEMPPNSGSLGMRLASGTGTVEDDVTSGRRRGSARGSW